MMPSTPVSLDLPVEIQGVNVDVESIAPLTGFAAESYDVANMTITATVNAPAEQSYRLVLAADVESGTSATARVVSSDEDFADAANFRRIRRGEVEILKPVLNKIGEVLNPELDETEQLIQHSKGYKICDLVIPAGRQVIRIHASQKVLADPSNPRQFKFSIFAPQLSFTPVGNVQLGVTVVFPLGFAGTPTAVTRAIPGQPMPGLVAGGDMASSLARQTVFGWAFQADPIIDISYVYS